MASNEVTRILICDDDGTVLNDFKSALLLSKKFNFEVETESKSERVLDKVEKFQPRVVLLDNWFGQGEVGVSKLLPAIKGAYPDVAVIAMTSKRGSDTDIIAEALGWDVDAFLDKPLNDELLIEKITKILAHE